MAPKRRATAAAADAGEAQARTEEMHAELLRVLLEMKHEIQATRTELGDVRSHVARLERDVSGLRVHLGCTTALVQPRTTRLTELPADVLERIAVQVEESDRLAVALSCRKLREALVEPVQAGEARVPLTLRTTVASLFSSLGKVQWGVSCGLALSASLCKHAAGLGQLDCLAWLRARGCAWDKSTCEAAAGAGHLGVLQWARSHGCPWDEDTCTAAAGGFRDEIEDRMFQEYRGPSAADFAATERGGHLAVLQWAHANGCPWNASACAAAAAGGHLAVLQWLRSSGCPWDMFTCSWAALFGRLEVLQWARANGCHWSMYTFYSAAQGGHLPVLQWLHANNCPCDAYTCALAANAGQLGALQWLRAHGCPWNGATIRYAAARGHTAVLEWARANGCPEDEDEDEEDMEEDEDEDGNGEGMEEEEGEQEV